MSHCGNLARTDLGPALATPKKRTIALVGNPNVGKSVVFNHLSGLYVDVSNYPGTTIELTRARLGEDELVDAPGVYGISSHNEEERVTRDLVMDADLVVNVIDGVHPERDLFLTLELCDLGVPLLVVVNFMDEVTRRGLSIDFELMSNRLGVPVIGATAVTGAGLDRIAVETAHACAGTPDPSLDSKLAVVAERTGSRRSALLLLQGDAPTAAALGLPPGTEREAIYRARRERVNRVVHEVWREPGDRLEIADTLGRLTVRPITGIPILIGVLWLVYQAVGVFVGGTLVNFTEKSVMAGYYEPFVRGLFAHVVDPAGAIGTVLVGEFGLFTMTITYLLGLLLPLVLAFNLTLAVMEDSGYLPRLATLTDRVLKTVGLNGRAIIPVILGFGCVQLGMITTRLLGTEREKTIATVILNFVVPCSAQIGVVAGMLGAIGFKYAVIYGVSILAVFGVVGRVLDAVLPGKSSDLLIELPPLRWPRFKNVWTKTRIKSLFFMKEAGPWFFVGAFVVTLLLLTGGITVWQDAIEPLTVKWLSLPKEAGTTFIMGMIRRDFGAAGLTSLALTPAQVCISLVVITLFVPCIATFIVLLKERGFKEGLAVWIGSWVVAFGVGGILARIIA